MKFFNFLFIILFVVSFSYSNCIDFKSDFRNYPQNDTLILEHGSIELKYKKSEKLSSISLNEFKEKKVAHGVSLVIDLKSGQVISLIESVNNVISEKPYYVWGQSFPAASIFKIIPTVAALEYDSKYVHQGIPYRGSHHSLKTWQIKVTPKSKKIDIDHAFAISSNPAYGILGKNIGEKQIMAMANKMGFNKKECDPLKTSVFLMSSSTFESAQFFSGYTQKTTISPIHAGKIMRALADDGRLVPIYFSIPGDTSGIEPFISHQNLIRMRLIMSQTIEVGTAKRGFNSIIGLLRGDKYEYGGKTGTLNGKNPTGLYDWFVGYVKDKDGNGIVIVTMIVHQKNISIKSSKLSAQIIDEWIRDQ